VGTQSRIKFVYNSFFPSFFNTFTLTFVFFFNFFSHLFPPFFFLITSHEKLPLEKKVYLPTFILNCENFTNLLCLWNCKKCLDFTFHLIVAYKCYKLIIYMHFNNSLPAELYDVRPTNYLVGNPFVLFYGFPSIFHHYFKYDMKLWIFMNVNHFNHFLVLKHNPTPTNNEKTNRRHKKEGRQFLCVAIIPRPNIPQDCGQ